MASVMASKVMPSSPLRFSSRLSESCVSFLDGGSLHLVGAEAFNLLGVEQVFGVGVLLDLDTGLGQNLVDLLLGVLDLGGDFLHLLTLGLDRFLLGQHAGQVPHGQPPDGQQRGARGDGPPRVAGRLDRHRVLDHHAPGLLARVGHDGPGPRALVLLHAQGGGQGLTQAGSLIHGLGDIHLARSAEPRGEQGADHGRAEHGGQDPGPLDGQGGGDLLDATRQDDQARGPRSASPRRGGSTRPAPGGVRLGR
jgi:hypothetical protein